MIVTAITNREVVTLYKTCKKVDSKLNSSYFDDPKLRKLMSGIKDEMLKMKTARFARKIQVGTYGILYQAI